MRSWVFPGNTVDVSTVARVREDLGGWKLSRVLFVGDAGTYSAENKKILSSGLGRYLLATPMRKVKEIHEKVLSRAGRYKKLNENLSVKEVTVGDGEARPAHGGRRTPWPAVLSIAVAAVLAFLFWRVRTRICRPRLFLG